MTSLNMSFAPVRSGKLKEELLTILVEDMEYAYKNLKNSGFIILLIGLVLVLLLSCCKVLVHSINYMKKPVSHVDILELKKGNIHTYEENGEEINPILTLREGTNRNRDYYQPNVRIKSQRAEALNYLRKYLYANDLELSGTVIKTINHKLTHDDLIKLALSTEIGHTFTTTYFTFGNDLNQMLQSVLPNDLELKNDRKNGATYLIAKNDDFGFIQEHLRNLYQEPVRVKFDDKRND